MEVIIDGIKYIPAKQAIANRDAIIRGLLTYFWGELEDNYDEEEKAGDVYCIITDSPNMEGHPTVLEVADEIARRSLACEPLHLLCDTNLLDQLETE